MLTENFIILEVKELVLEKNNSVLYYVTLYSTTFGYTVRSYINQSQYDLLSKLSQSDLFSYNLDGKLTKLVRDNTPILKLTI